jgi:hypothetical protein
MISNNRANRREIYHLVRSESFQALSAYQNRKFPHLLILFRLTRGSDLFWQFAPNLAGHNLALLDKLKERNLHPPFKHSVFTTAEWSFGNAASPRRKNKYDLYYTFCAITAIGKYPPSRGQVIIWKDGMSLTFVPGTTILFPGGCKRYSFAAVEAGESRFYFKQYFSGALARWVDKGGRSDNQFDDYASEEVMAAYTKRRGNRPQRAMQLYSKVNDLFV